MEHVRHIANIIAQNEGNCSYNKYNTSYISEFNYLYVCNMEQV